MQRIIEQLDSFIGVEHPLDKLNYALKFAVRSVQPAVIGTHHITCSDETERECAESFQRCFAQDVVSRLKFGNQSAFRSANLGGRYEWNSLNVAEDHFAIPAPTKSFKVMVVKASSHVSVTGKYNERFYGRFERYGIASSACGALYMLLDGVHCPSVDLLYDQFASEGLDRRALLLEHVSDDLRSLAVALVSARLQARAAALEAQDFTPASPTVYLILPAVTLNKPQRDTELLCGAYIIDRRKQRGPDHYRGLGDNPTAYKISHAHDRLHVTDDSSHELRDARDHRQIIARKLSRQIGPHGRSLPDDEHIEKLLHQAQGNVHSQVGRTALKALVILLAELTPVSAAALLFAQGVGGIYHIYHAHSLVDDVQDTAGARKMLADLHGQLDHLPADQARKVLEVLLAGYGNSR